MRVRIAIPSLLFTLLALCALHSSPSRVPVILILLHSPANSETPSLRTLIVDAITVELVSHDAIAVSSDEVIAGSSEVFSLAKKNKADFAIFGTYVLAGDEVELGLSWYDVGESKTFPEVRASGPLDLSFDSVVFHLVGELLDGQEQRLTSLPPYPQTVAAPTAPGPSGSAPAAAAEIQSVRLPRASPLSFSVGSAPFIPVFKASAYIPTVGLSVFAEGEYRFPFAAGLLGIVGVSGIDFFHAEKASVADAFAIPIAVGVVYRTLTGSLIDFAVRADAGPSIFVLSPAGGGTSVGVVPFVSAGLGVTLNFSALLAASVDLDYVAILVPDAIMGFVPSVALDMRF